MLLYWFASRVVLVSQLHFPAGLFRKTGGVVWGPHPRAPAPSPVAACHMAFLPPRRANPGLVLPCLCELFISARGLFFFGAAAGAPSTTRRPLA